MEKILLIASILLLHYPAGLFRDTARRFKRMQLSDNDFDYKVQNYIPLEQGVRTKHGIGNELNPIYNFSGSIIAFFSGLILSFFPLKEFLNVNWLFLILINFIIFAIVSPTIAFISTPVMTINSRQQLKRKTIFFTIIGIALYALAGAIKN